MNGLGLVKTTPGRGGVAHCAPMTIGRLIAAVGLAALGALGCTSGMPTSSNHPLSGGPAPEFHGSATSGRDVGVPGNDRTKATLVCFWASWCPTCQAALPDLDAIWRDYKREGLMFIGVSVDDSQNHAVNMAAELGATFPILMDDGQRLMSLYGVGKVPMMFVIDRSGTVRWTGRNPGAARDAVDAVLAE